MAVPNPRPYLWWKNQTPEERREMRIETIEREIAYYKIQIDKLTRWVADLEKELKEDAL